MANPIFHSQYTAAQIEDLIENGAPIIQNGYWWRWDVATQQYVNTNITADSETAAQAAEAAQAAAEDARDDAQDAQTAAETAQGLAEDARDAAAASAASIAASAAQIDANTARINYVALREEEDRQILFGSIVEAAEDSYPELRSAPIHNAITIGQSVYPRMDRTRMAIDAIRGRTVAWNQLVPTTAISSANVTNNNDGSFTVAAQSNGYYQLGTIPLSTGHVFFVNTGGGKSEECYLRVDNQAGAAWTTNNAPFITKQDVVDNRIFIRYVNTTQQYVVWPVFIDLTLMFGSAIADYIYSLETATAGAGVAYVRQRMDLDYYAPNAGELKAPVVSGVTVSGFNQLDEGDFLTGKWFDANGDVVTSSSYDTRKVTEEYQPCLPNTNYYFAAFKADGSIETNEFRLFLNWYDANKAFISQINSSVSNSIRLSPANAAFFRIGCAWTGNTVCVNLSNPSRNGEYLPYQHAALSLPSTRLDGVGTAQDYIEVVEDGENDYSLHLHKVMDEVDLGTLNWEYDSTYQFFYFLFYDRAGGTNFLCDKYVNIGVKSDQEMASVPTNTIASNSATGKFLLVKDIAYTDAVTFKAAMSGVMLAFEKTAPTETVIAEHLTLAEVSAIAENGGIISIVSETGHIVQPDMVADTVISRSAS